MFLPPLRARADAVRRVLAFSRARACSLAAQVEIRMNETVEEFTTRAGGVSGVRLRSGASLEADIVIIGAGALLMIAICLPPWSRPLAVPLPPPPVGCRATPRRPHAWSRWHGERRHSNACPVVVWVLVHAGIIPATEFLADADGIEMERDGSVLVDEFLQVRFSLPCVRVARSLRGGNTPPPPPPRSQARPDVFAAGDIARFPFHHATHPSCT